MKAMILAAGFGSRLSPLTKTTPKALVKIKNRPALDWTIAYLASYGIREIVVNTHYLHEQITSHLKDARHPCSIHISHEKKILGTGGGLYKTKNFWGEDDFIMWNVDILCDLDLRSFLDHHRRSGCLVTLGVNDKESKSMLLVDEAGYLTGRQKGETREIWRRPEGAIKEAGFCGLHLISPALFSIPDESVEFSIIDQYFKLMKNNRISISTWHIKDAYWEDIGSHEALSKANREFKGFSHPPSSGSL